MPRWRHRCTRTAPLARRWAATRRRIFERDGWRCRECGAASRLECDHVRPLEDGGAAFAATNLQALCRECHIAKTRAENERRNGRRPVPGRAAWRAYLARLSEAQA